jgi:hypothetical protein
VTEASIYLWNFIEDFIISLGISIVSIFSDYKVLVQTILIIIGAISLTNLSGISFLLILINSNDISDFLETVGSQLIYPIEVLCLAIIELGWETLGLADRSFWFLIKILKHVSLAILELGKSTMLLADKSFWIFIKISKYLPSAIFELGRSTLVLLAHSFTFLINILVGLFSAMI